MDIKRDFGDKLFVIAMWLVALALMGLVVLKFKIFFGK
jgi:hypothetical protein